jgi:MFS family permease
VISLIGTWTQQVAISWLVYRITGSTLLLGAVAFSNQIPTLFLGPFAGVVADRFERKRLLIWTQSLSMLQALTLAALVLTGAVQTWHIIALTLFIGIVNAFDVPLRQSFVIQMVEKKEDLGNAIALNSAMFNSARFIGPTVAGILISTVGEGVCFLVNGISYLAVLASLMSIRVAPRQNHNGKAPVFREFYQGIRYAFDFKPIIAILGLLSVFSIAGTPYLVLMPAYAKDVLHGEAHTFGFLMSAAGIGSLSATMYLASRRNAQGLIKIIPVAAAACGLGIASFAVSRNFAISLVCLFMTGFAMMTQIASSNTIIQTIVDEDKRGRVMSLYAMSFMGVMPFGSLLAGSIAHRFGVQFTLLLGASCCIIGASIFAGKLPMLCKMLKPVFADMGIPETDGLKRER